MRYPEISSLSNPKIKEAICLKDKRHKSKASLIFVEGPHLVEMAVASGLRVKKLFFTSAFSRKIEGWRILGELPDSGCEFFQVTARVLKRLSETETPQGIAAFVSYKPLSINELSLQDTPLLAVLEGVQDPGNVGAIIRTADAVNADAVILLPGTCDAFGQKAIRATAGSIFNLPVIYSDFKRFFHWMHSKKIRLAVTSLDAGKSVFNEDLRRPVAVVFGSEAHGVSTNIRKSADLSLKIPIYGKAESLNVAASAAVCLYEAVRQRQGK